MKTEGVKKGLQPKETSPPTIDDVYMKVKELIGGEIEEDPHKVLREMRDARG